MIPVAILSTNIADGDALDFDAMQVNPLTVEFGPNGAVERHGQGHVEDVDGDEDIDLVLHFNIQETGIACGDTEASLTGETFAQQDIMGVDAINVVCEILMCDVDYDDDVDINDIRTISLNRNQPAIGQNDPMDWDQNGVIDLLDARGCQLACTLPRCAVQ